MKKNTLHFNKLFGFIVLLVVIIGVFIFLTTQLIKKQTSTNARASEQKKGAVNSPLAVSNGELAKDGEFPFFTTLITKDGNWCGGGSLVKIGFLLRLIAFMVVI